jgi:hypothetical protein
MLQTRSEEIEAAGRILSQKNIDHLKSAFLEIGKALLAAGAISSDELSSLFEDVAETLEDSKGDTIEAGALKESFQKSIWQSNLREALRLFEGHILNLRFLSNNESESIYGETNKKEIAKKIISDLEELLIDMFINPPEPVPIPVARVTVPDSFSLASSSNEDDIGTDNSWVEDIDLVFERPLEILAETKRKGRSKVTQAAANNLPIKGVLFRVDEPSETAPSKGSEYPLFIPRAIAEQARDAINTAKGLPLDADNSLSRHANKEIVGVMVSAEIIGNDFVVQGHLFPWNQEEKVKAITSNQETLGMSLNAHASGQIKNVDGREVFCLSQLDILGANILFKDRATYQKTRLIHEIAASANNDDTEKTMDTVSIEQQLYDLQRTLAQISESTEISASSNNQIEELTALVQSQQHIIDQILQEKREQYAAIQAQSARETKEAEREALLQAMADTLDEKLESQRQEFMNALNPSRSPQRITRPLVSIAAEGIEAHQSNDLERRLIEAQAQLSVYQKEGIVGSGRIALTEEVYALKSQLGIPV